MLWEYLIENQFEEAVKKANGVCAVPIGCLEKHGIHSPLGTDTIISSNFAKKAAELEPVVVFPTMYFGEKSGSGEFRGTVIFSLETRWQIFKETCNEIYRNGFKKVVFCNGHGGNKAMLDLFARRMLEENPEVLVYVTSTGDMKIPDILENAKTFPKLYEYLTEEDFAALENYVEQKKMCGHACIMETAKVYHFCPDAIRTDLISAESGESTHRFDAFKEFDIITPFAWMGNYPNSYQATNNYVLNERIARAISEYGIRSLAKRFRFLKEETISVEYQKEWLAKR